MTYVVTTDAWIAPDPPEVKEIQDFDKRFGQKLMAGVDFSAWKAQMTNPKSGDGQMFAASPDRRKPWPQMAKEMAKLQGTRVMEVTSMGGSGTGPGAAQNSGTRQLRLRLRHSSNGQGSSDTPPQIVSGALGTALGSSALGGFHKKKPAPPPSQPAPADSLQRNADHIEHDLMETTMQKSNFSQAPVSSSAFEVPAGYKKVETPGYGAAGK